MSKDNNHHNEVTDCFTLTPIEHFKFAMIIAICYILTTVFVVGLIYLAKFLIWIGI